MCGENASTAMRPTSWSGSSPRVRGKHFVAESHGDVCRLIPACAGKTRRIFAISPQDGAHPRVCGENMYFSTVGQSTVGSSPRVRGKLRELRHRLRHSGLIPACAGKTVLVARRLSSSRAHPRVCGENFMDSSGGAIGKGSSPRVRGKLARRSALFISGGLIPACAGKT